MVEQVKLTAKNFFTEDFFAMHPFSDKLSESDRKTATIVTTILSAITLGVFIIVMTLAEEIKRKYFPKKADDPEVKNVNTVAQKILVPPSNQILVPPSDADSVVQSRRERRSAQANSTVVSTEPVPSVAVSSQAEAPKLKTPVENSQFFDKLYQGTNTRGTDIMKLYVYDSEKDNGIEEELKKFEVGTWILTEKTKDGKELTLYAHTAAGEVKSVKIDRDITRAQLLENLKENGLEFKNMYSPLPRKEPPVNPSIPKPQPPKPEPKPSEAAPAQPRIRFNNDQNEFINTLFKGSKLGQINIYTYDPAKDNGLEAELKKFNEGGWIVTEKKPGDEKLTIYANIPQGEIKTIEFNRNIKRPDLLKLLSENGLKLQERYLQSE